MDGKRARMQEVTQRYDQANENARRLMEMESLVVPDADVAVTAGKLFDSLPTLWEKTDLGYRTAPGIATSASRSLLMTCSGVPLFLSISPPFSGPDY